MVREYGTNDVRQREPSGKFDNCGVVMRGSEIWFPNPGGQSASAGWRLDLVREAGDEIPDQLDGEVLKPTSFASRASGEKRRPLSRARWRLNWASSGARL